MNPNQDKPLFTGQPNVALEQQAAGYDADLYKKKGYLLVGREQQSVLWFTKLCCCGFMFVSALAAFIVVLAASSTFGFKLETFVDYRNGAGTASDGYPPANQLSVGAWDVALNAAIVSIIGFLGYLFVLLFHAAEVEQMNRGANPYVWIWSSLWTPAAFLVWALVAGVSDIYVLVGIGALTWGWLWLFWQDDLLHSYFYRNAQDELLLQSYTQRNAQGEIVVVGLGDASMWSWVPYLLALILALIVYIIIFVHLSFTFGAPIPPDGALLFVPLAGLILYLGIPIIILLGNARWLIGSMYAREMALYIYGGFVITVATWLSLAIFAST